MTSNPEYIVAMYVHQVKTINTLLYTVDRKSFTGLNFCSFHGFYKTAKGISMEAPWSQNQSKSQGQVSGIFHCHGNGQGYISVISIMLWCSHSNIPQYIPFLDNVLVHILSTLHKCICNLI